MKITTRIFQKCPPTGETFAYNSALTDGLATKLDNAPCKTVSLNRKENNSRERITKSIFPGSRFPKSNGKLVTEIRHEASYEVTFEGTI